MAYLGMYEYKKNLAPFYGWASYEYWGGFAIEKFSYTTRAEVREHSNWRMTLRDLAEYQGGP